LFNPNSPKVILNAKQQAIYFSRSVVPYIRGKQPNEWLKTQVFYKHIGIYAYKSKVLKEITSLPQSPLEKAESLEQLRWLENGYVIKVGITNEETIGIDTPEDLERANQVLSGYLSK
jgi:3-deoxy-manno-octulosonate cytidylyltransferase (CMP-KDO synthetase)